MRVCGEPNKKGCICSPSLLRRLAQPRFRITGVRMASRLPPPVHGFSLASPIREIDDDGAEQQERSAEHRVEHHGDGAMHRDVEADRMCASEH